MPNERQEMIHNLKNFKLMKEDKLSIGDIHIARFELQNENQLFDRDIYMRHHTEHERNALKLLRSKTHLLIDVTKDARVEMKLCDFLEIDQPLNRFPHLNKSNN